MKYIYLFVFLNTLLISDEIARMESIVADVQNLRVKHQECKRELELLSLKKVPENLGDESVKIKSQLEEQRKFLAQEREQNNLLNAKINALQSQLEKKINDEKSNINKEKVLKTQENTQINKEIELKYISLLKDKENQIKLLKKQIDSRKIPKELKKETCEEENTFPKLLMKESYTSNDVEEEIITPETATYRLNKDSMIYDAINGKELYEWENKTSFTSTASTQNWVEISGYFINKQWKSVEKTLWIEKLNVTKR